MYIPCIRVPGNCSQSPEQDEQEISHPGSKVVGPLSNIRSILDAATNLCRSPDPDPVIVIGSRIRIFDIVKYCTSGYLSL